MIDWTITVGTILQTLVLVVGLFLGWVALKNRILVFENILQNHARQLTANSDKMVAYEKDLRELVGMMQRLIGEFGMFLRLNGKDK